MVREPVLDSSMGASSSSAADTEKGMERAIMTARLIAKSFLIPTEVSTDDESEKSGLSVYNGYKGKTIRRKDGFVGTVTDVYTSGSETYLSVHVTGGKDAGKDTKIQLSFMLKNKGVYTVTG